MGASRRLAWSVVRSCEDPTTGEEEASRKKRADERKVVDFKDDLGHNQLHEDDANLVELPACYLS